MCQGFDGVPSLKAPAEPLGLAVEQGGGAFEETTQSKLPDDHCGALQLAPNLRQQDLMNRWFRC